ncbi:GTP 3',8-cyclase MoaA [Rothia sp. ZJ1223]|uniref:GTP 3',8-cyclase MoaA n=1 Tax=Rothia sp. ZJ1223 TaxID=2811098 RepID=UPI00195D6F1B|nr:GTP 3',8-cyclase MoaA [Rothia sp. ZJ1223]MBM7051863.1 GTP 3',8-cyclase MoaA [Rothia sp. ZJ1223]
MSTAQPLGAISVRGANGNTVPGSTPPLGGRKLLDQWGRTATDLRISLIDKCNLRCVYCMPAEGLQWLHKDNLLSLDEVVRLARIGVRDLGVEEIRFTGGEPLVRADFPEILRQIRAEFPEVPLSVTTNGIGLEKKIDELIDAGLTRLNVSMDTICRETFAKLTRRDRLDDVIRGIDYAASRGISPIKINAVLMPGVNDHEAPEIVDWALERGYQLRFIEQMPLDADHNWDRDNMITAHQMREMVERTYDLTPHPVPRKSSPAMLWDVLEKGTTRVLGQIGIIASVTEPFCSACSRTRITSDGKVRSCLFSLTETDLMGALRSGASDEEVADIWRGAMWSKPAAHGKNSAGFEAEDFVQPERSMSAIGG